MQIDVKSDVGYLNYEGEFVDLREWAIYAPLWH